MKHILASSNEGDRVIKTKKNLLKNVRRIDHQNGYQLLLQLLLYSLDVKLQFILKMMHRTSRGLLNLEIYDHIVPMGCITPHRALVENFN